VRHAHAPRRPRAPTWAAPRWAHETLCDAPHAPEPADQARGAGSDAAHRREIVRRRRRVPECCREPAAPRVADVVDAARRVPFRLPIDLDGPKGLGGGEGGGGGARRRARRARPPRLSCLKVRPRPHQLQVRAHVWLLARGGVERAAEEAERKGGGCRHGAMKKRQSPTMELPPSQQSPPQNPHASLHRQVPPRPARASTRNTAPPCRARAHAPTALTRTKARGTRSRPRRAPPCSRQTPTRRSQTPCRPLQNRPHQPGACAG